MADRVETVKRIEVMQAFVDGVVIQAKIGGKWYDWNRDDEEPSWNWHDHDYRIKPVPREWWVNVYPDYATTKLHPTKEAADKHAVEDRIECVKVREVLDGKEED